MAKNKREPLPMTDEEICIDFRTAKDKAKQVDILADLCATTRARIVDVLLANGVDVSPALVKLKGSANARRALKQDAFSLKPEPEELPAAETETETDMEPAAAPEPEASTVITVGMLMDILTAFPDDAPILCAGEGIALVRVCQQRIYGPDYVRNGGPETMVTLWAGDPKG